MVVVGRLVEVKPEHVVVDTSAGRKEIARADISTFRADATAVSSPAQPAGTALAAERPESLPRRSQRGIRSCGSSIARVTLPWGTVLPVELTTAVASDSSHVEDAVRGNFAGRSPFEAFRRSPRGPPCPAL